MAVLKHVNVRNKNYTQSVEYLMYKHDGKTGKVLMDENGEPLMRDGYLIEGINTTPESFACDCRQTNQLYDKNNSKNEIKAHHYIISFDPIDIENGLTIDKAQQLGMEFAKKHFGGHECLVCTHDDGNNRSGNIHVHIVFNSVRKLEMEKLPFMKKEAEYKIGCKHQASDEMIVFLKKDLMEICKREKLSQIDLVNPAEDKVTDREYRAKQRGHILRNLFRTIKQILRDSIRDSIRKSKSMTEFEENLKKDSGITVTYRNGKIRYLLPNNGRFFTGKSLGTSYEKDYIETCIEKNRQHLKKVIDVEHNKKAQNSIAYGNALRIENIQRMSETLNYLGSHGITPRMLDDIIEDGTAYVSEAKEKYLEAKYRLENINMQIQSTGQYLSMKKIYSDYLRSDDKKAFREEHGLELSMYESARKELRTLNGGRFRNLKELKAEKAELKEIRDILYNDYESNRELFRDYVTARENLAYMRKPKRTVSYDLDR